MLSPRPIETPDADLERSAFNAAFHELGLRWHWDGATYDALCAEPCERRRVQRYLEAEQAHLLRAYDAGFLVDAILAAKGRAQHAMSRCTTPVLPRYGWADARWGETGF
ncbi:MAG TPA: hypothetical protein VFQ16_12945 [Burkholderiaceae bacterium]|nr:hypothetical protein [Burkholderiaceae bacterium]